MKVGVIRCMQTEDMCPGTTCFKVVETKKLAFEGVDEKIEIIKWDEDPAIYIANALSPAKAVMVAVNEEEKISHVVVADYNLSLAIGKAGQNARLAAKLTNWKIDIKSESQAEAEPFEESGDNDVVMEEL